MYSKGAVKAMGGKAPRYLNGVLRLLRQGKIRTPQGYALIVTSQGNKVLSGKLVRG